MGEFYCGHLSFITAPSPVTTIFLRSKSFCSHGLWSLLIFKNTAWHPIPFLDGLFLSSTLRPPKLPLRSDIYALTELASTVKHDERISPGDKIGGDLICTKTWHETQRVYCLYKKVFKVKCTDAYSTNCTHGARSLYKSGGELKVLISL